MLTLRHRRLTGLGTGPALYSTGRGWYCPGGESYLWPDPACLMQCLSTYPELQALVARTQGLQCPVAPVQTVEGPVLYASAGAGIPTTPVQQPARVPAPAPELAWNPPPEQTYQPAAQPPPPAPTTTTTEEVIEESGRPAVMRPWTSQLPAGLRELAECLQKVPCWLWLIVAAVLLSRRQEVPEWT